MNKGKKPVLAVLAAAVIIAIIIVGMTGNVCKKTFDGMEQAEADNQIEQESQIGEDPPNTAVKSEYLLQINAKEKGVDISETLYGLFFEDINFAGDGGLYAELIKNRSFEYGEERANQGALHGYKQLGESVLAIENSDPIHENNPSYLVLTNPFDSPAGFVNNGFLEGIHYKEGEPYRFSVYLRSREYKGDIRITFLDDKNNAIGSAVIGDITVAWKKHTVEITAEGKAVKGTLSFELLEKGSVDVDMVSLFPVNTYKNRENGLRADMVEIIEALNPSFIRFPGGCIVEGDSMETAYNWKDTVGDVAYRKQNTNLWIGTREHPYYQSYGLGFYEYFLLCEDLGAKPVPVINAGLACQARTAETASMNDLEGYIQDALDLIEFANGDSTTQWGQVRARMGHPEPFHLEYLAIGNENWDQAYFTRYSKFVKAIRGEYPGIKLITSSGPHSDGVLYNYAWNTMDIHKKDVLKYADIMDEHYYNSPEWFLAGSHRYDDYKRHHVDVFVGEYAAKSNSLYAAIAEAAYMTGLERNSDVVKMASYAPLFGNLISRQWNPDLIYFNNNTVYGSINYYVQKMFAGNVGDYTVTSLLETSNTEKAGAAGKVGLGTWLTSAVFDDVKVVDNETGAVLYETDFEEAKEWKKTSQGDWKIIEEDGNKVYGQTNAGYPSNGAIMGSASYIGEGDWTNYTYTLKAKKISGEEGFLIPFAVKDGDNFYHWNIGGWGNTDTCVEQALGGTKNVVSDIKKISVTAKEWYDIKIEVKPDIIRCYLNGELTHEIERKQTHSLYETVSYDRETGDLIIKIVNAGDDTAFVTVDIRDGEIKGEKGSLEILTGERKNLENIILKQKAVTPVTGEIAVSEHFVYEAPAYSVSVIRVPQHDMTEY